MDEKRLARRGRSFDAAVGAYERARPGYPDAAAEWILPPQARRVLDLGAGSGKFTRSLVGRGLELLAVEPLPEMRRVLAANLPEVEAVAGTAEEIPLADASVDLVAVAQAWHWIDEQRALPEIARVLRPGGRLALVWNRRDERVPWVAQLSEAMESGENEMVRMEEVEIHRPFGPMETFVHEWGFEMDAAHLLELVRSRSYFITAPAAKQEEIEANVRDLRAKDPALANRATFELPYRTFCFRADLP